MEAIRNHVQHRAFPISGIKYSYGWQGGIRSDKSRFRTRVYACLDVDGLNTNPKLTQKAREAIRELTQVQCEHYDLTPLLREYIEQISTVHDAVRKLCGDVDRWLDTLTQLLKECENAAGGKVPYAHALVVEDSGAVSEDVPILEEPLKLLKHLRLKNRVLSNLRDWYVTNERD
jgi:hypothetical protein